jgi:predicted hydrocarbon binding protein
MKRKKSFLAVLGIIAMLFVSSCLSDSTWYNIGYDIGSKLNYEGKPLNYWNNIHSYSCSE